MAGSASCSAESSVNPKFVDEEDGATLPSDTLLDEEADDAGAAPLPDALLGEALLGEAADDPDGDATLLFEALLGEAADVVVPDPALAELPHAVRLIANAATAPVAVATRRHLNVRCRRAEMREF